MDAAYFYQLSLDKLPFVANYGSSIFEDDGHNYLYGSVSKISSTNGYNIVCARTQGRSLKSPWEYYIKDDNGEMQWTTDLPTIEQVRNSKITGVVKAYGGSVFKYGDYYYMVSQNDFGGNIQIAQGENPWGPFKVQKKLYTIKSDEHLVNRVFVHPQLSRLGELVISYTTEPEETTIYTKGDNGEAVATVLNTDERNRTGWGVLH